MEPELVVPGVHLLPFEIGQAYLWQWEDSLTVIDTGITGSAPAIIQAIGALGQRPEDVREIVLTHFHPDHCGGAIQLGQRTRATVVAHQADAPVIRLAIFVYQGQLYPYAQLGAAGCWSIGAWMGPWPLLALRDACAAGDWERAQQIALDLTADVPLSDLRWRENSLKISINEAGYCQVGPLRPPFTHVPDEVVEAAKARGRRWREMAERYQAMRAGVAAPA